MSSKYPQLLVVLAVGFILLPRLHGKTQRGSTVIATVNGRAVKYKELKLHVDVDALVARFRGRHGHNPETEADRQSIQAEKRKLEIARLTTFIKAVVHEQETERLVVVPTEQEIKKEWEAYCEREGIDPDEVVRESKDSLQEIIKALEEVIDQGQAPEDVYERRLADKMSRGQWDFRIKYDGTPERLEILKRAILIPDSQFLNAHEAARKMLIMQKLNKAIEDDLIATDLEFAEYVRLAKTDPRNEKVQSKGHNYWNAKRFEWWQQRYREARVEIKDERFKDAWK